MKPAQTELRPKKAQKLKTIVLTLSVLASVVFFSVGMLSAYTLTCGVHSAGVGGYLINPNFQDSIAGTEQQQIDAVNLGADEWAINGNAKFFWTYGGTTEIAMPSNDNNNVVFATQASGGNILAEAFCYMQNGTRFFDIRYYDGNHSWNHDSSVGSGFDIAGIGCHEFGHSLGLGHSGESGATMWPSSLGDGVANRSIENDDINGIQFLYGENIPPHLDSISPNSGTITGGTLVTVHGSGFFQDITRPCVGDNEAILVRWVSQNEIWIRTPPGDSIGLNDITLKDRFAGNFTFANVFEYEESPVLLTSLSGPAGPGRNVEIQLQGPPGATYGIASSRGQGLFIWRGFQFSLGNNIAVHMKSISGGADPPLDGLGLSTKCFRIPEDATLFEEFVFQGVVKVGGELIQTNKLVVQVLQQ